MGEIRFILGFAPSQATSAEGHLKIMHLEFIRNIKISVEIDTNKDTYEFKYEHEEDMSIDELIEKVKIKIKEITAS